MTTIARREIDPERTIREIGDFILWYMNDFEKDGGTIGLSGGIDSAITAYITKKAFDRSEKNFTLRAYNMPTNLNSTEGQERAEKIADRLGVSLDVIPLQDLDCSYHEAFHWNKPENKHIRNDYEKIRGNMLARVRANCLHTKAEINNHFVIGTGNYDEDTNLGYYTLFGDGAVHISPIGSLTKRHLYEIAYHIGWDELIHITPSAELEEGQTDMKDLGYSYIFVELVCEGLEQHGSTEAVLENKTVQDYGNTELKLYKKRFGESKFDTVCEMIDDIERRRKLAKNKQLLVSPNFPFIKHGHIEFD